MLAAKYKNPEDEENFKIGEIYAKKMATNVFKCFYYVFITLFGYYVLTQTNYFPTTLGGHGNLMNIYEGGQPAMMFHVKPNYFNLWYMIALAYNITDLVWLGFFYELQTDFLMMLLHHVCTISLVSFSYLSNYSHIGSVVLSLHDTSDIFVYITRFWINSDVMKFIPVMSGVALLIIFIYTRIFVLGTLIYSMFVGIPDWNSTISVLYVFLIFLYFMHLFWVYLILKRIILAVFKNKIGDTYKINKIDKTN